MTGHRRGRVARARVFEFLTTSTTSAQTSGQKSRCAEFARQPNFSLGARSTRSAAMTCAAASARRLAARRLLRGVASGTSARSTRSRARRRMPTRASIEAMGEPSVTIEDDASERAQDSAEASSSARTRRGVFVSSGRFNASPKALWRALTSTRASRTPAARSAVSTMWISSRVGRACRRSQSCDRRTCGQHARGRHRGDSGGPGKRRDQVQSRRRSERTPDIGDAATESGSSAVRERVRRLRDVAAAAGEGRFLRVRRRAGGRGCAVRTLRPSPRCARDGAAARGHREGRGEARDEIDQIPPRAPRRLPARRDEFRNLGLVDRGGGGGGGGEARAGGGGSSCGTAGPRLAGYPSA